MDLQLWPSAEELKRQKDMTPEGWGPSTVPLAAVLPGYLSDFECDNILESLMEKEPYSHSGCGAETREAQDESSLIALQTVAEAVNEVYFGFSLFPRTISWLQTYEVGGKYQRHMDAAPGQTRKLTAVLMLSHPSDYMGGHLELYSTPKMHVVHRARGTIAVFPSWLEHAVTPVVSGTRQTINMGFWGPAFR